MDVTGLLYHPLKIGSTNENYIMLMTYKIKREVPICRMWGYFVFLVPNRCAHWHLHSALLRDIAMLFCLATIGSAHR